MVTVGVCYAVYNFVTHVGRFRSCGLLWQKRDILISLYLVFYYPALFCFFHVGVHLSYENSIFYEF